MAMYVTRRPGRGGGEIIDASPRDVGMEAEKL